MDWSNLFGMLVVLAVFSVFVTSIIEVVKGISAIGVVGLLKGLWNTLVNNKQMASETFPVLNFSIALLCCWAFNVTLMSRVFAGVLFSQDSLSSMTDMQEVFARYIDYFGTASIVYAGSDQIFKKFLAVKQQAETALAESKKTVQ